MAEYIEREALLQRLKFKRDTEPHLDGRKRYGLDSAISQVRKAPTADVAEVRHGAWHKYTDYFTKRQVGWICTNCSAVSHDLSNGDTPFCPRCGAMMDLEDDDDGE